MKIDLHCHTKSTKTGDSPNRNISCSEFIKNMVNKQVSIVAITNHNYFDEEQYLEFYNEAKKNNIDVWPGIELDVIGKNSRGHIIVISNPKDISIFTSSCNNILINSDPNKFEITVNDLCENFKENNIILLAHYGTKSPSLSENDLDYLRMMLNNRTPMLFETTNLRSAGILYAHNINCFIGSDIKNWSRYNECELPELKMPISNFEHFCLLLKKDEMAIKTMMDKKTVTKVDISPFEDCNLSLNLYKDINIIFGSKGTGKSKILEKIKDCFDAYGNSDVSYYNAQKKNDDYKKLVNIENEDKDFDLLDIDDCSTELSSLVEWKESTIVSTDYYFNWANNKNNNKLSESFGFKNCIFCEQIDYTKFESLKKDVDKIKSIKKLFYELQNADLYLKNTEKEIMISTIELMLINANRVLKSEWISAKSLELEKFTIDKMKAICTSKTGISPLPSSTGLLALFDNCITLYNSVKKINTNLSIKQKDIITKIGEIPEKGTVHLKKSIFINPKETYLKYPKKYSINVSELKTLVENFNKLSKCIFNKDKNELLKDTCKIINDNNIDSLRCFVGVKGNVCNSEGDDYEPSNGEESIILLTNALIDDSKNYFILDEPEMSLGHQFINDIILKRLIELSKMNKTIIISTHDANIAVRSLPMLTIYREYCGGNVYKTYCGNPFSDTLSNVNDDNDKYSWTQKSIEMLEGGSEAFAERNNIYDM